MRKRNAGYSGLQIALHWLVALLIVAAYTTSDDMNDALETRLETGATGIDGNTTHVWIGGAVFALILLRIATRAVLGAPPPSDAGPPFLKTAAIWGHRLIYLLLIAVPALGATAWYLGVEAAGEAHETFGNLLILVALGHAAMAIYHDAAHGDGTIRRMIRPGS